MATAWVAGIVAIIRLAMLTSPLLCEAEKTTDRQLSRFNEAAHGRGGCGLYANSMVGRSAIEACRGCAAGARPVATCARKLAAVERVSLRPRSYAGFRTPVRSSCR